MIKDLIKNKFYEEIHEAKSKYSKTVFLKKYIRRYKLIKYINSWLYPLMTYMLFFVSIGLLVDYIREREVNDLILLILGMIGVFIGLVLTHIHITFYSSFIDKHIESWDQEYRQLKLGD